MQNAVLCDDIRPERDTNKHILIGVFSGDLVVPEFPATLAPALYVEYWAQRKGKFEFSISYSWQGKNIVPIRGRLETLEEGVVVLVLPQAVMEVSEPTRLEVSMTVGTDAPIALVSKKVISVDMAPGTGLRPTRMLPK